MADITGDPKAAGNPDPLISRRREWAAFVILAVLIWPIVAIGVVGGYGFLVWMSQLFLGPPGPPG